MSEQFIGEIRLMSFIFPPKYWALCNGQLLPIAQNQALFSLLGTMYGGNGTTTFALPDLRGRMPVSFGPTLFQGQVGGEEAHTLNLSEIPAHTHTLMGSTNPANQPLPDSTYWATQTSNAYSAAPDANMAPASIRNVGGNQPHTNRSPYLVLNFCIALVGIYPSRN